MNHDLKNTYLFNVFMIVIKKSNQITSMINSEQQA